ncbi:MAG: hypothetical protein AB2A00_18280 [Myxococcota bacterium]
MKKPDEPTLPPDDDLADAPELRAALDAWETPAPPVGFVDRVMSAHTGIPQAQSVTSSRRPWRVVAPVALAAAALLVALPRTWLPSRGDWRVDVARELKLGGRAVAAASAGAQLRWDVRLGGATHVTQDSGTIFYRVEPGSTFVVETPAGTVTVQGTCFQVDVDTSGRQVMGMQNGKQVAMGALVGATLSTAVLVTVYEGKVAFANTGGQQVLTAGQSAVATSTQAPQRVDARSQALEQDNRNLRAQRRDLQEQLDALEQQLKSMMMAQANGQDPLVAENRALRDQLASVRRQLEAERAEQQQRAGETVPWPANLGPQYQEEGLKKSFLEAISAAGMQGDVKSIDCTEFPCVVYGEARLEGDKKVAEKRLEAFEQQFYKAYPENEHSVHQSLWTTSEKGPDGTPQQRANFAMSVYPKDTVDEDTRNKVRKRLRHRNEQYMQSALDP